MADMGDRQRGGTMVLRARRIGAVIAATIGLTLSACDSGSITGLDPVPVEAATDLATDATGTAMATVQSSQTVDEFELLFPNPCTGEAMRAKVEVRRQIDLDDKTRHIVIHSKYRFSGFGLDAAGNPTTTRYNGSGEDMFETNANGVTVFETTQTANFRVFATDYPVEAVPDDFTMHVNNHITVHGPPSFKVSAQVDKAPRVECK